VDRQAALKDEQRAAENGELQNRAGERAAEQGGLHIYTGRRALEKGVPSYSRTDCVKIIILASFRRSSRCATWRAVRYNIARTSCFENDDLSSLLHALEFFAARATAKQNNTPSYRY